MIFSRSRKLLALTLVLMLVGIAALTGGTLVTKEDPLAHADAIYVLGGSWTERWLEATDLYKEGYAPLVIISRGAIEPGQEELERRGIRLPSSPEIGRTIMTERLGVPADAVRVLNAYVDNTAAEADAIRVTVRQQHWRRLIVITSRSSTRRAGFAMRRILGSDGVEIIMRASRTDGFVPGEWLASRSRFRDVFYEAPKLLAYWLGLKG